MGTGADSYAQMQQRKTEPHKPGQPDYSLIETLLKHRAHRFLEDHGRGVRTFADQHENQILIKLCTEADIKN